MSDQQEKAARFLDTHRKGSPLLLANAWDQGSARLLASLGFEALATTSSGFAATLGRRDGSVTRDEALAHSASIVAATDLPVSADLEDCFAAAPAGVAETVALAVDTGLAGCSIEDFTRDREDPIYELALAAERVAAAAEAAHAGPVHFVLYRSRRELPLRPAGPGGHDRSPAGVPGGGRRRALRARPGRARRHPRRRRRRRAAGERARLPGGPPVPELAAAGVARVSVGGAFAFAALGAVVEAAEELRGPGTYGFSDRARTGGAAARSAFTE